MRAALTDASVRALQPGPKQTKVWDTRTRGFGVLVSGHTKSWFVCYGTERRLKTLGRYPDVPLAKARREALVLLGTTPGITEAPTYPDARDQYLQTIKVSDRVHAETKRLLTKYFHWKKRIDQITHDDVAAAVEQIEAPSEALHAFKYLRTFFNACVPRYLKVSPCTGLKPPSKYTPRARVLTDAELKSIWRACEQRGGTDSASKSGETDAGRTAPPALPANFATIVKLLILTGQRRTEIASLQTSWLQEHQVTFPSSVTKNGREHTFPIGTLTTNFLMDVLKTNSNSSSTLLFPARGHNTKSFNGWSKSKAALDKLSGVTGWTLHDLRRTWATNMARLGVPIHVIEKMLNHVSGTTGGLVGIYQRHRYWEDQLEATRKYEKFLLELVR